MPINETLTGSMPSTITMPNATAMDCMVSGDFGKNGSVTLYHQQPGKDWLALKTWFADSEPMIVLSPDTSIQYRFESKNVESVDVYLGP